MEHIIYQCADALHLVREACTVHDSIVRERRNRQAKPDLLSGSFEHADERAAQEEVLGECS